MSLKTSKAYMGKISLHPCTHPYTYIPHLRRVYFMDNPMPISNNGRIPKLRYLCKRIHFITSKLCRDNSLETCTKWGFYPSRRLKRKISTVDSLYLEHLLSRTSLYLELKSQSLCVGCNLFFSLYLELSLSRTNSLVPCELEIERVNWISPLIKRSNIKTIDQVSYSNN